MTRKEEKLQLIYKDRTEYERPLAKTRNLPMFISEISCLFRVFRGPGK